MRILSNSLPTKPLESWRTVDPTPAMIVGGKRATGKSALDGINGAVLLGGGGIVVSDRSHSRLVFFDRLGAFQFGLPVTGAGDQRAFAEALVPFVSNQMAQWDGVGNRLTILDASGRVRQLRHIENPPDRADNGGHWRPLLHLIGAFASGEVLASVKGQYSTPDGQTASDSVTLYHVTLKGKLDTLGKFLRGERFGFSKRFEVGGQLPLGRIGSFAVDGDVWYYSDGASFAIQRRSPSGHVLSEIRLDRPRVPVTAAIIAHLGKARLERSDPELRMADSLALQWMSFPRLVPAYTALMVDSAHHIWARAWAFDDEMSRWDIFDQSGRFLGTVDVPPDLAVLQINANYLVARYTRDPNVDELRVYRLLPAR